MQNILVVDDEKNIRDSLKLILEYEGYEPLLSENGKTALKVVEEGGIDLVLLDIKMPGLDGMEVLEDIKKFDDELPVIMISGHGTIETAVEATKKGAYDFLEKPLDREKILVAIRNALRQRSLSKQYHEIKSQIGREERILGESNAIKNLIELIEQIGPTDSRVLITGENGTGKQLAARAIHEHSERRAMPFVEVNCAAIPNELLESELFGHEKGAFTGASTKRIGKFEAAHKGTLFLDEIGDMTMAAQAKVLRAIEEGKIERLGSNKIINVDVRVVAATNQDLNQMMVNDKFRKDLFHRLNVIPLQIPPLRERTEDIPILAQAFADDVCKRNGFAGKKLKKDAVELLCQLEWNGNVRELRNIIERLVIMVKEDTISAEEVKRLVPEKGRMENKVFESSKTFHEFKENAERKYLKYQLEKRGWNVSKTAEDLKIQRSQLYNKIKKYRLER